MADETSPVAKHQPEKSGNPDQLKKGGMLSGKNKWYVVGGLAVVAVLVFYFVSKSNSAAQQSANSNTGASSGLDPATMAALESALAGSGTSFGTGTQGPAGPAGPAGKSGPPGKTGKPGSTGKQGPGKNPPPKKGKKPVPPNHDVGGSGSSGPPKKTHASSYTVKSGNSLSSIAQMFGISNWQTLYNANRNVIGNNPNLIYPGQKLVIP